MIAVPLLGDQYRTLILGQGMLKAGWDAHNLNAPGKFLVSAPGLDRPKRARAYLLTDEVVAYTAAHYAGIRPVLDEESRRAIVSNRGTRGRSCCGVGWAGRSYPRPACGGNIAGLTVVTGAVFDAAGRPGHDPAGIAARLTASAPKLRRAPQPVRLQILSQPAETGQRRQPGRVRFAVLLTMWPDMTRSRDERVTDQ